MTKSYKNNQLVRMVPYKYCYGQKSIYTLVSQSSTSKILIYLKCTILSVNLSPSPSICYRPFSWSNHKQVFPPVLLVNLVYRKGPMEVLHEASAEVPRNYSVGDLDLDFAVQLI